MGRRDNTKGGSSDTSIPTPPPIPTCLAFDESNASVHRLEIQHGTTTTDGATHLARAPTSANGQREVRVDTPVDRTGVYVGAHITRQFDRDTAVYRLETKKNP